MTLSCNHTFFNPLSYKDHNRRLYPEQEMPRRLSENAHLLRYPHPSSLWRTSTYASFLRISDALHLGIFHQPLKYPVLRQASRKRHHLVTPANNVFWIHYYYWANQCLPHDLWVVHPVNAYRETDQIRSRHMGRLKRSFLRFRACQPGLPMDISYSCIF